MFCFLDTETTGINLFQDHVLEIGAILVDDNYEIVKEFHSYIKPDRDVSFSKSSKNTHGMKESFFKDKIDSKTVLNNFFDEMGTDYRFVGWNISFDVGFFRKLCHINNMTSQYNKINYRHIDLQSLFYLFCRKNNIDRAGSLNDACEYFNIRRSNYHNAEEDAFIAYQIFKRIVK